MLHRTLPGSYLGQGAAAALRVALLPARSGCRLWAAPWQARGSLPLPVPAAAAAPGVVRGWLHSRPVVRQSDKPVDSHTLDLDEQHQASAVADYGPATDAPPAAGSAEEAEMREEAEELEQLPLGTEIRSAAEQTAVEDAWDTDTSEQEAQRMGQKKETSTPKQRDKGGMPGKKPARRGFHTVAAPRIDQATSFGQKASEAMNKVHETVAEAKRTVNASSGKPASGMPAAGASRESHTSHASIDTIDGHIIRDHAVIKLLYNDYNESLDEPTKERKIFALIYELARHSAVEELILYSWLQRSGTIPNGADIAKKNQMEHQDLKLLVKKLDRMAPRVSDSGFLDEIEKTMRTFVKHGDEEEISLLPLLRKHCSRAELVSLGQKYEHAASLVTSRPHPLAPTKGVTALAAHLSAKPLDLVRDWFEGRLQAVKEEASMAERRVDRVLEHQAPPPPPQ